MKLTLPDKSKVFFDSNTFHFSDRPINSEEVAMNNSMGFDINLFREKIENPNYSFGKCFRRLNDTPRYSSIKSTYSFDFTFLTSLYRLDRVSGYGGMFSSSESQYAILDGRIIDHQGYGWGNKSWTALEGYNTLRLVCLYWGIKQPLRIKGETDKCDLSEILFKLSNYVVNPDSLKQWNNPWQN